MTKVVSGLENGEYEKELTEEQFKVKNIKFFSQNLFIYINLFKKLKMKKYMIDSPVLKSAEQFKNIVVEAESIRFKLESKEEEIREIKKMLKLKVTFICLSFQPQGRNLIWILTFLKDRRTLRAKAKNKPNRKERRRSDEGARRKK